MGEKEREDDFERERKRTLERKRESLREIERVILQIYGYRVYLR